MNFIPLTGLSSPHSSASTSALNFKLVPGRSTQESLEIFSDKNKELERERKEVLTSCLPSSSAFSDQYKKGFSSSQESLSFLGGLVTSALYRLLKEEVAGMKRFVEISNGHQINGVILKPTSNTKMGSF